MTVDAHHHLWQFDPSEFPWISDAMQPLRRDYLPSDLYEHTKRTGVEATVAVQARQSLDETRWLLELAAGSDVIRGIVGWAPLVSEDIGDLLAQLSGQPKLKGLRHIVQDEPDDRFLLRDDFNRGVSLMANTGLVYDILVFARHLPVAIEFVDRHPTQAFVLDHLGKPTIRDDAHDQAGFDRWAAHLRELARRPNVSCKLSGMVTEADWSAWSLETLRPYLDVAVESFGPQRLMVGSDWPVCLLASSYTRWFDTLREYFGGFSEAERERIFGGTATEIYDL